MASLEQWTEWREEYYAGLKQIIDDAPYNICRMACKSVGDNFVPDVARAFVVDALKEGVIKETDPLSFAKMTLFAMIKMEAYNENKEISIQDVEALCHEPDYPFIEITTADDYIGYAFMTFLRPIMKACSYVFSNYPKATKKVIVDLIEQSGAKIEFTYFRLSKEELFNYFRSVKPFCLHNMLADMKCPYAEEVFDAVQEGNFEFFKTLCYDKNIDFTELSEIVGYLQSSLVGSINDGEEFFESDECSSEINYSRLKNVVLMAGLPHVNPEDIIAEATMFKLDIISKLLPFIQTKGDASIISSMAYDIAHMYMYIERMNVDEQKEIYRLLDHPDFEAIVTLAQMYFHLWFKRLPNNVTIHYRPEEQSEILSGIQEAKNAGQEDRGQASDEGEGQKPQIMVAEELHWPTQEELDGYPLKRNDTEFFKESIFGSAASVKVSHIEKLYNCLVSQKVLHDDLETKLILLARYTGRRIPLLELRPIEWRMSWSDKERSLGYFLLRTANSAYANGVKFFYYDDDGKEVDLNLRTVSTGAHSWKNRVKKPKLAEALDNLLLDELKLKYPED